MATRTREIDKGWNRIRAELRKIDNSFVKVGVVSDAKIKFSSSPSLTTKRIQPEPSLAVVAAANEFGVPNLAIPARPFMRQSFDKNKSKINRLVAALQGEIYAGTKTTKSALNKLGVFHKGQVQDIFTEGRFAPNAPSTIAKKKSSKPLIDTGRLRQSIDFEVTIR